MFQAGWGSKQSSIKQLAKIQPYLQEVKNNYSTRLTQSLWQILNFYLGSTDSSGILIRFGNQFATYQPMQWAKDLQKILQHILPGSPAFNQLYQRSKDINAQIIIPTSYLPHYMDSNSYDKIRLTNLKVDHKGLSVQPLDAFYIMLAYAIYQSQPIGNSTSQYEHLFLDQFYSSLSRNPLLVLLRKNIQYFKSRQKQIVKKIVYILRMYLFDQVVIKYEQQKNKNLLIQQTNRISYQPQQQDAYLSSTYKKTLPLRYRLKTHHLHSIYLLLNYGVEFIGQDFYKYCQGIVQYFTALKPDMFCLQTFIRVWIYGILSIRNQRNIENQLMNVLEYKANAKQGWYFLKRYSPTSIFASSSITGNNIQVAISVLKLLQKQSLWTANSSYLFTLACFFQFMNSGRIYYSQFATSKNGLVLDTKENMFIEKIMRMIIVKYNQNVTDILGKIKKKNQQQYREAVNLVQTYEGIIQQYYLEYFRSKNYLNSASKKFSASMGPDSFIPNQFKFQKINEKQVLLSLQRNNKVIYDTIGNKSGEESKRGLVAFYRNSPKGCWEIPIQYNQSALLYYFWYSIAKVIDILVPGKRESPFLNLRFLANPITFFVVFAFILLVVAISRQA